MIFHHHTNAGLLAGRCQLLKALDAPLNLFPRSSNTVSAAAVGSEGVAAEFLTDTEPFLVILHRLFSLFLIQNGQVVMSINRDAE